jgi:hypothetical protein|tara:strand:+ start:5151 stop:6278 length:1128 start_codon:yes stop_codon:yes gene_type:complete
MKLHFGHLLGVISIFIAGCAAFFSVYGIGMLFSGAMIAVIIMGSSLELGKLVAASYLQRYWKSTSWLIKTYLTLAIVVLMGITSGGIYGFLSSAYQETFQKLALSQNEISFLETKKDFFDVDVIRYDKELDRISTNISELSGTKTNSIQIKDTTSSTGVRNTISTSGLRMAQKRIEAEEINRENMMVKRTVAADSLQKYQLAILNKQNSDETSAELGPLLYISKLTNTPMDKIVNYFILVFIIVFDPLAVILIIATNRVFTTEKEKREGPKAIVHSTSPPDEPKLPKVSMFKKLGNLVKRESKTTPVNEVKVSDKIEVVTPTPAPVPVPTPAVRVNQAQLTNYKDGVKREEIKEIRENTNKERNFTRNIPARRGH